jgi:hypothetical protein
MNTLIEQRSDTKDPDATNEASIGVISLKDLMTELQKMWDVSWYIDDDGYFRIEHEKFFYNGKTFGTKTVGIYLTDDSKYVAPDGDKYYIEDTQFYESGDIEKLKSETIKFTDEDTYEFRSEMNYITYDVVADLIITKEHNITLISTDVGKAINNPDDLMDDGFFFFNCEPKKDGYLQIISRERDPVSPEAPIWVANAAFSVKWLLHDYYGYGRSDKSGVLSVAGTYSGTWAVIATKPIYIQKDVTFLLNSADVVDVDKYIRTFLIKSDGGKYNADGSVIKIAHDLETDFIKCTLGYEL